MPGPRHVCERYIRTTPEKLWQAITMILSGLKTLLETGERLPINAGAA